MREEERAFMELYAFVTSDPHPPKHVPMVYAFSETDNNKISCIQSAVALWRTGKIVRIGIAQKGEGTGYSGFDKWRNDLLKEVPPEAIVPIPFLLSASENLNTFSEATALVRFAKEQNLQMLDIVAPSFHLARCFMSVVSVLVREYPELVIFNRVGDPLDWFESVVHSQGILRGTRIELLWMEFNKILEYMKKGDLLPFDDIFSYMQKRVAA